MNWNYYGNEAAVAMLRSHIAQGAVRQAYLFSGPSGIGRRTLALRFAQAMNCLNPPQAGGFCGKCRSCQLIGTMRHPDLAVVAAEQRGGVLRVEQIRELQHQLSLAPYEANYRIALILRSEEANLNAQNALLKTLEEPPPKVILFLTAADSESLLPTIVSRCEVLRLRPMAVNSLIQLICEIEEIERPLAAQVARLAAGRPGIALRLLQNPEERRKYLKIIEEHLTLLASSYLERFALAERLAKDSSKAELIFQLEHWLALWRDVLLVSYRAQEHLTYCEFSEQIAQIAEQVDNEDSRQVLKHLRRTLEILQSNVNLRLAFEVLFLNLPYVRFPPSRTQIPLERA
ncbi:MAG: DNA polymerase III subunit [Anaerolineales bacterium]|nr:DNA polymerase III subunit [Anaerolineales bacterium]